MRNAIPYRFRNSRRPFAMRVRKVCCDSRYSKRESAYCKITTAVYNTLQSLSVWFDTAPPDAAMPKLINLRSRVAKPRWLRIQSCQAWFALMLDVDRGCRGLCSDFAGANAMTRLRFKSFSTGYSFARALHEEESPTDLLQPT